MRTEKNKSTASIFVLFHLLRMTSNEWEVKNLIIRWAFNMLIFIDLQSTRVVSIEFQSVLLRKIMRSVIPQID